MWNGWLVRSRESIRLCDNARRKGTKLIVNLEQVNREVNHESQIVTSEPESESESESQSQSQSLRSLSRCAKRCRKKPSYIPSPCLCLVFVVDAARSSGIVPSLKANAVLKQTWRSESDASRASGKRSKKVVLSKWACWNRVDPKLTHS